MPEGDETVEICATLSVLQAIDNDIEIVLATNDGTGEAYRITNSSG